MHKRIEFENAFKEYNIRYFNSTLSDVPKIWSSNLTKYVFFFFYTLIEYLEKNYRRIVHFVLPEAKKGTNSPESMEMRISSQFVSGKTIDQQRDFLLVYK